MALRNDLLLRIAAIGTALGTILFLFIGDGWKASNIFLVPDLLVAGLLLAGALVAGQRRRPLLLIGFGAGIGVFLTANADYLVQGRFGIGAAVGLVTSLVAGAYILASGQDRR